MKKIISIILATISFAAILSSCGANTPEETTSEASSDNVAVEPVFENDENDPASGFTPLIINSENFVVTAKDGFDSSGFTSFVCDTSADYAFISDDEDVSWSVFILDAPFDDALRYINQSHQPDLTGNGIINIKKGRFIYIYCSSNGFTSDEPSDAELEIFYPGTISGTYTDTFSERAEANVIEEVDIDGESELHIRIHWISSATEADEWTINCEKTSDGKYKYDDCRKYTVTTDDDGKGENKLIYTGGSGFFTLEDGKLLWNGAAEEECRNCVFINNMQ